MKQIIVNEIIMNGKTFFDVLCFKAGILYRMVLCDAFEQVVDIMAEELPELEK